MFEQGEAVGHPRQVVASRALESDLVDPGLVPGRELARILAQRTEEPIQDRACEDQEALLVRHGEELAPEVAELHALLYRRFYRHEHLQRFLVFARAVLDGLFGALREDPRQLSSWYQAWVDEVGLERAACVYLAGMTDRFALLEHERLVGPLPDGFALLREDGEG